MIARWELLAGVAFDLALGDPRWLPHPIRAIGWLVARAEAVCRHSRIPLRMAGALMWIGIAGSVALTVWVTLPWLTVYWIWTLLALRGLDGEAAGVVRALEAGDLPTARANLSMIVGRDTSGLEETEILRAVIETVSENTSDAVIAPVFFLMLGGPVAMAVYKAANTMDSMVGHRNDRYREFGWFAARVDDAMNLIPARLTAALVWISAFLLGLNARRSVRITLRDARLQPSPNSGYPEAAYAGALGVRLGGSSTYGGILSHKAHLGDPVRPLSIATFRSARQVLYTASFLMIAIALAVPAMTITHGGNLFEVANERGWNWHEVLDFSASINPLGLAPGVREAIVDTIDEVTHYPVRHGTRLAAALAERWNVEPDQILLGNGSTELIHFFARVWKHDVTLVVPTFSEFHRAYPDAAWAPAESPASWPEEGLLILTRPNNPVGMDMFLPDGRSGPLMVDESFIDFTDLQSSRGTADIVLTSLTKICAIPGLRAGALVGPGELVGWWREERDPWELNVLAEAAVLASLRNPDHLFKTREYVARERMRLWPLLRALPGVSATQGCANFYFTKLDYPSAALCEHLLEHKILVRNCTGWIGIEGEAVRFAIRTPEENDRLLHLWGEFKYES